MSDGKRGPNTCQWPYCKRKCKSTVCEKHRAENRRWISRISMQKSRAKKLQQARERTQEQVIVEQQQQQQQQEEGVDEVIEEEKEQSMVAIRQSYGKCIEAIAGTHNWNSSKVRSRVGEKTKEYILISVYQVALHSQHLYFTVQSIARDGNCFWWAVDSQLHGANAPDPWGRMQCTKLDVLHYLEHNLFQSEEYQVHAIKEIREEELAALRGDGAFVENTGFLCLAISHLYNVTVEIYWWSQQPEHSTYNYLFENLCTVEKYSKGEDNNKYIRLLYQRKDFVFHDPHYMPLVTLSLDDNSK